MTGYLDNIENVTEKNENFRQVLFTGQHAQLVAMSLEPLEDIGTEVHQYTDQFIRIEEGEGKVIMNGEEKTLEEDTAIVIPAGVEHNIINTSADKQMKLYTLYSPPHHKDGTVHATKQAAETDKEDHI